MTVIDLFHLGLEGKYYVVSCLSKRDGVPQDVLVHINWFNQKHTHIWYPTNADNEELTLENCTDSLLKEIRPSDMGPRKRRLKIQKIINRSGRFCNHS